MLAATILIHLLIVAATLTRILARGDMTPTTRLTWAVVLVFIPYIGAILYFFIGEISLGTLTNTRAQAIYALVDSKKTDTQLTDSLSTVVPLLYRPAFGYASSINGFPTTHGNKAELMADAQAARSRLLEDIDNAILSVNVLYYIWLDDETGTNVAQALIRAAKRGVECRAMTDAMGSRAFIKTKLWVEMQEANVKTSIALPYDNIVKTLFTSRIDLRNHRKITVIDNNITYCGSQNCSDPEFAVKPKFAPWIDILLRFEGPVVVQNQLLFAGDWLIHDDADIDTLNDFAVVPRAHENGFAAQVWGDGPTVRASATPQMFSTLIGQAQDSLTISTPYFVPGDVVLNALCAAAYRGVTVTIIFPENNDSWIVAAASRSHYKEMLDAGIVIHEYKGGLLHSKTMTIDGEVTLVGSSNMDLRSFDLNYENNILLYDQSTTRAVYNRQQSYISSSTLVSHSAIEQWSLARRIWQNIIATLGPVL